MSKHKSNELETTAESRSEAQAKDVVAIPREEWTSLIARVAELETQVERLIKLEETLDRFVRQYKSINHLVQELNWRFTEMYETSAGEGVRR